MNRSLLLVLALIAVGQAADAPAPAPVPAPAPAAAKTPPVVVAVLPCDAGGADLVAIARAVPELIATNLGRADGIEMVERDRLDHALSEQELGASGVVDPEQAARIGKVMGARVLICPRVYAVDDRLFITAKVMNAETGRVKTATKSAVRRTANATLLAGLLTEDVQKIVVGGIAAGPVSDDGELDAMIERMRKAIGDKPRPVVTVIVPEEHLRHLVPDPAVETELVYLLRKLRFKVVENDSALLEQWVKDKFAGKAAEFPAEVGKVDLVIHGGAFAETVGQVGNLVSARARVELKAIEPGSGDIVAVVAKTGGGADLSQNVAGKAALSKAARAAAERFIVDVATQWAGAKP